MKKYSGILLLAIFGMTAFAWSATIQAAPPANDNFAGAQEITFTGDAVVIDSTNVDATRETGEPFHYFGTAGEKSVWYKWTAAATFSVQIELAENFHSSFSVYTSNSANPTFAQLTSVNASTDASGYGGKYQLKYLAQAGKTYYIAIDSAILLPREGNFQLKLRRNHLGYTTDFTPNDYRAEISVFRPSEAKWYSIYDTRQETSGDNVFYSSWGLANDTFVLSDYNGDHRTDLTVARNVNGKKIWYFQFPFGGTPPQYTQWGLDTDKAAAGDFDRDGRSDLVAIRQTANGLVWYVRRSSDASMRSFNFGLNTDKPVFADFDGDGATEVAVTRNVGGNLEWHILSSGFVSQPNATYTQYYSMKFGLENDVRATADFDGDEKADIAVFRPLDGSWQILRSGTNQVQTTVFGTSGDTPHPADYDGDGKADLSVYRASEGSWYIWLSGNNTQRTIRWGAPGDVPISALNLLSE